MLPQPDPELAVEHGLFTVAQALASGISESDLRRGLRRGRWKQVSRGVLTSLDHRWGEGDDLLFAVLTAGPAAVVAHRSAAQVLGWDLLREPNAAELILPRSTKHSSAKVFRSVLHKDEVIVVGLLVVTTPERTAVDLAARLPLAEAVAAIDGGFRSGTLSPSAAEEAWRGRPGTRGHRRARQALDLADPLSGSVPESETRVLLALAGLPAPVAQYEIYEDGELLGRVDFAWLAFRLALEVDGRRYHSDDPEYQTDRTRQNAIQKAGWLVLRYTVEDIRVRPAQLVQEVREVMQLRNLTRS